MRALGVFVTEPVNGRLDLEGALPFPENHLAGVAPDAEVEALSNPSREAARAPAAPRSRLFLAALFALSFRHRRSVPEARAGRTRASFPNSEWNLFARRRLLGLAASGHLRPRAEELDTLRDDFRALALAASVLALEFPRAQPAFNVGE
jgi:hypothetical protein